MMKYFHTINSDAAPLKLKNVISISEESWALCIILLRKNNEKNDSSWQLSHIMAIPGWVEGFLVMERLVINQTTDECNVNQGFV